MKYLYKSIADILTNDSDLKKMVAYTDKNINIRRAYQPEGSWEKLIIFYLQPDIPIDSSVTEKIREIPLIIRVYDRDDDLNCEDIAERLILLLDGADLSVSGKVHVYDISYTGVLVPTSRNNDLKTYEKVIRFSIKARMDEVVGNSGLPTRKRQRSL